MNIKHFLLLFFIVPLGITFSWADGDHLSIYELEDYVVQSSPLQLSTSEKTQSTTVLDRSALNETRSDTLAETLSQQAGVAQSYYGPHSNRPIIRGLDGFRVSILENGLSAFDLSATSADHAVSIDPLMIDRLEILRGSSTLIYGSNALGGVVNIFDKGIPNLYDGTTFKNEYRTRYSSANDGYYNGGILYHQSGNFVFQINASSIETDDYETPLFEAEEDEHAHHGGGDDEDELHDHVENSHSDIESFGFGGSYTHDKGFIGLSYSDYASSYGVPNAEKSVISIDRKKLSLQGVSELDSGYFDRMDFQLAYGDYSHEEAPGEDGDEDGDHGHGHGHDDLHAQFLYEGIDSRIILSKQSDGSSTALSLSYTDSDMKIEGDESYLAAMEHNALHNKENYPDEAIDPTDTSLTDAIVAESTNPRILEDSAKRLGLGFMHKKDFSNTLSINGGVRYETLSRDYDAKEGHESDVAVDIDRDDSTVNGSIGFVKKHSEALTFSGNVHYSERIPETSELYSSGAHHATESFEIGNPNLENEASVGIELAVVNQQGAFTQKVSAYFNDYSNFIYQSDSGFVTGSHDIAGPGDVDPDKGIALYDPLEVFEELTIRQYKGVEAEIYGFEYTFDYQLSTNTYLKGFADTISAQNKSDGIALPRIPPWRFGIAYHLENPLYKFSLDAVHHGEQDDLATGESVTEAYTTVNARLGYFLNQGDRGSELYLRVKNLTDELGFVHTSFLKGSAPIAGRSLELGLNIQF
jgi:iron complex outermembrane receptor protein